MTAERWQTVKSLYLEVATLAQQEQDAFLRNLESEDAEISAMVKELLSLRSEGLNLHRPCWSPPETADIRALEIGDKLLDRFEIVGFLGAGGLGEVYRVFDHQQQVFVALKTLRVTLAWDRRAVSMLRRELNTARSVTNRNVCRLYDFHWSAGSQTPPFVTMELLEGETLAEYLRREGAFSVEGAKPLLEQMLNALDAAHREGIVHRDFKAANVMLTEQATKVVVMDFGLAKELDRGEDLQSTLESNSFAGTPAYMAPEQLRGERATFSADVHALGVVLFEMMTSRRPFEGASALEVASRRLNADAPSPRLYAADLDRRWEFTILRCLASDPSERPKSIGEIRQLLERDPPLWWLRRRTLIGAGIAAALAAAAGATAMATSRLQGLKNLISSRKAPGGTAMDYYVRGNSLLQEGSPESVQTAVDRLERAVTQDPQFALAYASLAEAYLMMRNFASRPDEKLTSAAAAYAKRAIAVDPGLAEGHAALGAVYQLEWNWSASEASYNEALRLKPEFARARRWRAGLVLQFGRFDEALSDMRKAFEQDPYDRSSVSGYGLTLLFAGRDRDCAVFLKENIGGRDMPIARYNLCQAYARLGRSSAGAAATRYFDDALAEAETVSRIETRTRVNDSDLSTRMFALVHLVRQKSQAAEPYVKKLETAVAEGRTSPGFLAILYTLRGRTGAALDALERAISLRDGFVLYLRVHVFLQALWGQPRFELLLRNLRLK
jgi:serine/threonine protein kinase